ncbi:MAG: hypothetical protein ACOYB8_01190 [Eubacteriaceae bacterium]
MDRFEKKHCKHGNGHGKCRHGKDHGPCKGHRHGGHGHSQIYRQLHCLMFLSGISVGLSSAALALFLNHLNHEHDEG